MAVGSNLGSRTGSAGREKRDDKRESDYCWTVAVLWDPGYLSYLSFSGRDIRAPF